MKIIINLNVLHTNKKITYRNLSMDFLQQKLYKKIYHR